MAPKEPLTFRIDSVEDPNEDDTLQLRWFLNAEPGTSNFDDDIQRPTGETVRSTGWQVDLVPCSARAELKNSFYLEAVVADRPFEADAEPKFRGVAEDGFTVHLGWRVTIDEAAVTECSAGGGG